MTRPGKRNLITDVAGITIGNVGDTRLKSGVTAILCEEPATAAVHVMGGAPGTRETDMLAAENSVERADAIVLSGGSALKRFPQWPQRPPNSSTRTVSQARSGRSTRS